MLTIASFNHLFLVTPTEVLSKLKEMDLFSLFPNHLSKSAKDSILHEKTNMIIFKGNQEKGAQILSCISQSALIYCFVNEINVPIIAPQCIFS